MSMIKVNWIHKRRDMKNWMKFLVITIVIFGALPIIGNIDGAEKNE